ncbi:MAG: hypothetical protein ACK55Z_01645, partial [bacterium]
YVSYNLPNLALKPQERGDDVPKSGTVFIARGKKKTSGTRGRGDEFFLFFEKKPRERGDEVPNLGQSSSQEEMNKR